LLDHALRWTVTALFAVSFVAYGYCLVAQHRCWTSAVSHLLHLAMSAAMIWMAWGLGAGPVATGVMIGFLLSGAWFVRIAGRAPWPDGRRLTNYYYAAMMAAMAWMYASMNGRLPGGGGRPMTMPSDAEMPGMDTPAHDMSPGPGWVAAVNWVAAIGFGAVAIFSAARLAIRHRTSTVAIARLTFLRTLTQALTAAGTAVMIADML
jgi:hypothetical protein